MIVLFICCTIFTFMNVVWAMLKIEQKDDLNKAFSDILIHGALIVAAWVGCGALVIPGVV